METLDKIRSQVGDLHLRLEEHILLEAEGAHACNICRHVLSIRITNGYIDGTHATELLEDALEDTLARLHLLLVLDVTRTEPTYGQVGHVYCIRPFARLHLIHVAGIAEIRVPIMTRGKLILCLRATYTEGGITESG